MFDPYIVIIGASVIVGLSYVYDIFSKKFKIPSVLFLIGTGILIGKITDYMDIEITEQIFPLLELLGIIGLIMIVLEAAVDLKISRQKFPVITRSLLLAIFILIVTALAIALPIVYIEDVSFYNALVYAIPLSVVSSAVLIPSIHNLTPQKREFMIYESTFSDITGIMFFNFMIIYGGTILSLPGLWMILLTILLSFVLSYILVYFFSKLSGGAKLFLMLAILAILYSIGKQLHLSSLLIILIFGIVLNNSKIFFRGPLRKYLDFDNVKSITEEFRMITAETAFVVRTFFFVVFGLSIDLAVLTQPEVLLVGSIILVILFIIRYLNFKMFIRTDVFPEIFLAPRGLITILLFYSIPSGLLIEGFSEGVLFFVILGTSIIMMIALLKTPKMEYDDLTPGYVSVFARVNPTGPHCDVSEKIKDNYGETHDVVNDIEDASQQLDHEKLDSDLDKTLNDAEFNEEPEEPENEDEDQDNTENSNNRG